MKLRWILWIAFLVVFAGCAPEPVSAPEPTRPNILLVVTDDQGHWACGPCGNTELETPTMDFLAESGTWFANATSPSPVCSPARASLLTGRIPSQHGIHDFLSETGRDERDWLAEEILLPELLRDAGYFTALVGKWHLSGTGSPTEGIFDRWLSYDVGAAGWRNQYLHRGRVHLLDNGNPLTIEGSQTAELARLAVNIIEDRPTDQPLFLLFAPTDTHAPFDGHPEEWVERYRQSEFAGIPGDEASALPANNAESLFPDDPVEMLSQYFAAVSAQDAWIGKIIGALDAMGELDDTFVIMTSDHGHMNGHHGLVGKANATLPQNLYEEVIRVPLVVRWPGRIPEATRSEVFIDHMDLFATVLDAAGVELDSSTLHRIASPGRSVLPALDDPSANWRRFRFAEHGNVRMVADERWKLVRRSPPLDPRFGDELYDLEIDPRETTNLAEDPAYGDEVSRLNDVLTSYFERYEDPQKSGARVMEQPPANGREPWTRMAESLSAPE